MLAPFGQLVVTLVQHHAMDVLLLAQPAEEPVLIHPKDGRKGCNHIRGENLHLIIYSTSSYLFQNILLADN